MLGKVLWAVDGPDGEHDMEDVVGPQLNHIVSCQFAHIHYLLTQAKIIVLQTFTFGCTGGTHERSGKYHQRGKPI